MPRKGSANLKVATFGVVVLLATVAASLWVLTRQNVAYATVPDCAAAEKVVAFTPGPDLTGSPDPSKALGFSDGVTVSLGKQGVIVLEFAGIADGPEKDFRVYTVQEVPGNPDIEPDHVIVEVSENGATWVQIGDKHNIRGDPPSKTFNIGPTGLSLVRFIRLTDGDKGAGAGTDTAGFDLDAVGVINCAPPPPPAPAIDIEKFTLVVPQQAGDELCADFGKPKVLTMRYTGDGNDATSHSQASGKVVVTGDPNDATPVRILVTDKSNPADSKAKVFFDGIVGLGNTFEINAANGGLATLKADTYAFVYSLGGSLLQSVKFHTSCSQPLFLGDQFGSLLLVGFLNQLGNGDSLPDSDPGLGEDADTPTGPIAIVGDTIVWSYVVTNIGGVALINVVVTDDQGVAVSCPKTTLAIGESMICTASGTAVAGQYANIGAATGEDANGTQVMDLDPSHYFGEAPHTELCADFGKPKVLTMRYTGDGNDATSHSQASGKVVVTGDPNDATPVRILVTDKSNPADSKAKVFFDGIVGLGNTFEINAANGGLATLKADTYAFVYSLGGSLLQSVKFHTSCSQPLFLGDQFGSLLLVGFVGAGS